MKRLLIAAFASLLAAAVMAPGTAQSATKYRYWQDLSISGPYAGQVSVTIAYEDKRGNRKFRPRYAAAYQLQAATSCGASAGDVETGGNAYSKYSYFMGPLINGRFTHRFENQFEQPAAAPIKGDLTGRVLPRVKKAGRVVRAARVDGAFDVEHWNASVASQNCVSSGRYSATPCKRWRSKRDRPRWYNEWKVPICSVDPW